MNLLPRRRTVLATAELPIFPTVRSTTEVNSSNTHSSGRDASARASVARNCSPFDSTANGRNHAGGEEKPTDDSSAVTSLIDIVSGKPSMTAAFLLHSKLLTKASG